MYCSADLFVISTFRNINTAELGLSVPGLITSFHKNNRKNLLQDREPGVLPRRETALQVLGLCAPVFP
jgi:hypothetical protein